MIWRALTAAAALAGCAGLGWALSSPPTADDFAAPQTRVQTPVFERDGVQLALAVGALNALGLNDAPPDPELELAAVQEEDIAAAFRRDLTAIVRGRRTTVWVVDPEQEFGRRAIRVGGNYRDDWRLQSVRDQEIVLRRGEEERRVSLVDAPPGPAPAGGPVRANEPASARSN